MTGTTNVVIYDGGIYSNYCLQIKGTVDVELIVDYGNISYVALVHKSGQHICEPCSYPG